MDDRRTASDRRAPRRAVRVVSSLFVAALVASVSVYGVRELRATHRIQVAEEPMPEPPSDEPAPVETEEPTPSPDPSPSPSPTESPEPLVCRNSTDPACGPFYWDPDPAPNAPMAFEVSFEPAHPRAGDVITFTLHASDADAPVWGIGMGTWDDDTPMLIGMGMACETGERPRHGPWTPPDRQAGDLVKIFTHVFDKPGTYVPRFQSISGPPDCESPYGSGAWAHTTVVVGEAPSPSPNPSPSESPSPTASPTPEPTESASPKPAPSP